MKCIVGMSGGIDSSLAAHLLKKSGYDVEGLSIRLFETRGRPHPAACCSMLALEDAARTAEHAGVPHRIVDLRDEFIRMVIEPFVEDYLRGVTPNPCILCNRHIKFPFLMKEAGERGADFMATGHYAVVERGGQQVLLKRGVDPAKDQSYVLYGLRREELHRLLLPLGAFTKEETRRRARAEGLPVTGRPESQEICFVEDNDYGGFIRSLNPEAHRPGPIVDEKGNTLGTHGGIYSFTVGQRKGLGISSPTPLYVTAIDAETGAVHVGPREGAMRGELTVGELNWLLPRAADFRADVKVRSTMRAEPALIRFDNADTVRVVFDAPQFAPTPGQAAVFYEGDVVLGGGTILEG
jgi:tRNA-specific 2-thiouridylase